MALVGIVVYFNNLHVPFLYDDITQIAENAKLQNPATWSEALTTDSRQNRTLQNLTFHLNWVQSPGSPISFHVFNNSLHIVNATLLYLFLCNFIRVKYLPQLTSFFFLIHPLQVQSVTYIMGRISLLQTFITLLIMWLASSEKTRSPPLIFLLLCLSVTIKETCIFIPVLILAFDVFIQKKPYRDLNKKEHALYFSHLLPAFFYHRYLDVLGIQWHSVGFDLYPLFEYLLVQAHYLLFYIYLFFNPVRQSIYHGYPDLTPWLYVSAAGGIVLYLCAVALIPYCLTRRFRYSVHAFFVVFFVISFMPTNSILQMYNPFAEYRLYQGNIVFCLCLSYGIIQLAQYRRVYSYALTGVLSAYFLFFTYSHNLVWRNALLLWQHAFIDYPQSFVVLTNLGVEYARSGQYEESLAHFEKARGKHRIHEERVAVTYNLAFNYQVIGKLRVAEKYYEDLYMDPTFSRDLAFLQNYALLEHSLGRNQKFEALLAEIKINYGAEHSRPVLSKTETE